MKFLLHGATSEMPQLPDLQRGIAIGLIRAGNITYKNIALQVGCHPTTISRLHDKYLNHNIVKNLPKTGRPKVTTRRQDGHLRAAATRTPTITGNN